ncbi:MAG: nucleotide exchange factor GrpE [Gemmataceae bacterium]
MNDPVVSPEMVENVLGTFRNWLTEMAPASSETALPAEEGPDLYAVLEHFTALRHEINLQTKAVRAQQEQNAQTLGEFGQALETLKGQSTQQDGGEDDEARPLLQTIVGLYDSLTLAAREVRRVQDATLPELKKLRDSVEECQNTPEQPWVGFDGDLSEQNRQENLDIERSARPQIDEDEEPVWVMPIDFEDDPKDVEPRQPRRSLWRWLVGERSSPSTASEQVSHAEPPPELILPPASPSKPASHEESRGDVSEFAAIVEEAATRVEGLLSSVVTGYTMSVDRIDRALEKHGLEPIPVVGEPFDPEVMEVLDVVTEPGRTQTEVIEELRRGYLKNGQVFRFAQVRVAKPISNENQS